MNLQRRGLFRGSLSLGALTMLTGCDISDHESVQRALGLVSAWNDRVQAAIFGQNRLAPTFPDALAVKDFRHNAWYGPDKSPRLEASDYRLSLAGQIADKRPWSVERLYALPQVSQVTRHICVEGWSMICIALVPIRPRAMSGSSAPTATTRGSTWRPRCTRRH